MSKLGKKFIVTISAAILSLTIALYPLVHQELLTHFAYIFALMLLFATVLINNKMFNVINRRIRKIIEGYERFSGGDFTARIEDDKDDEISMLATAFNKMASDVQHHFNQLNEEKQENERVKNTLSTVLNALTNGILFVDGKGNIIFVNKTFVSWFGDYTGKSINDLYKNLWGHIVGNNGFFLNSKVKKDIVFDNGKRFLQQCMEVSFLSDKDRVWIFEDITEVVEQKQMIKQLSEKDEITGLYRKNVFYRYFEMVAGTGKIRSIIVGLIGINDYGTYVSHYGMTAEIMLQQAAAKKLKEFTAEYGGFVAKENNGKFYIVFEGNKKSAKKKLDNLFDFMQNTKVLLKESGGNAEQEAILTFTGGITVVEKDGKTHDTLIQEATDAYYYAKKKMAKGYVFFDEISSAKDREKYIRSLGLINKIIIDKNVQIWLQGIHGQNGKPMYYEALFRYKDEHGKLVFPGDIVPHAEQSGNIVELDKIIIERVASLIESGAISFPVSINVSQKTLSSPQFLSWIDNFLAKKSDLGQKIYFEITETALADDVSATVEFINVVSAYGVKVFLDDFGAGFMPLHYLKTFKVDGVKIDGKFIIDIMNNRVSQSIVESIISLAKKIEIRSVAEFVETEEVANYLFDLGVDAVQGYAYSKAKPVEEIVAKTEKERA